MNQAMYDEISQDEKFHELVTKRRRFVWLLCCIVLFVYYSFILLIAFEPSLLAKKIGNGLITWGMPFGIGIILLSFILTGIYIKKANGEFDLLNQEIKKRIFDDGQ